MSFNMLLSFSLFSVGDGGYNFMDLAHEATVLGMPLGVPVAQSDECLPRYLLDSKVGVVVTCVVAVFVRCIANALLQLRVGDVGLHPSDALVEWASFVDGLP